MSDASVEATRRALIGLGLAPGAKTLPIDGLTLTIVPRDPSLASKDIPVEALFSKLTSMRDKLRVLEQRINAAERLGVAERAALQAQITATYAAFAGFAAFFSDEAVPPAIDEASPPTTTTTAPTTTTTAPPPATTSATVRRS